jgi:hypothetical protein
MIRIRGNTRNRFILRIRRSLLCCGIPTLRILRLCRRRILRWTPWSHGFLGARPPLLGARPPLLSARQPLLGAHPPLLGARPPLRVLGAHPTHQVLGARPPLLGVVCSLLSGALRRQITLCCSLRLSLRPSLRPLSLRLLAHQFLLAVGVRLRC